MPERECAMGRSLELEEILGSREYSPTEASRPTELGVATTVFQESHFETLSAINVNPENKTAMAKTNLSTDNGINELHSYQIISPVIFLAEQLLDAGDQIELIERIVFLKEITENIDLFASLTPIEDEPSAVSASLVSKQGVKIYVHAKKNGKTLLNRANDAASYPDVKTSQPQIRHKVWKILRGKLPSTRELAVKAVVPKEFPCVGRSCGSHLSCRDYDEFTTFLAASRDNKLAFAFMLKFFSSTGSREWDVIIEHEGFMRYAREYLPGILVRGDERTRRIANEAFAQKRLFLLLEIKNLSLKQCMDAIKGEAVEFQSDMSTRRKSKKGMTILDVKSTVGGEESQFKMAYVFGREHV